MRQGVNFGNKELTDSVMTDGLIDVFNRCHMGITGIICFSCYTVILYYLKCLFDNSRPLYLFRNLEIHLYCHLKTAYGFIFYESNSLDSLSRMLKYKSNI